MKTTVRELRPDDMQSFVDLTASRDTLTRKEAELRGEIVEHIAFKNPCDDGNPTYFIGVQGDRVLAHLGRMPTRFCIDGSLETASFFHDLYVHPELRKEQAQGFFLSMKLYRKCERASQSFGAMIWTNEINISLQKARKYRQMWTDRRVLVMGLSEKVETRLSGPTASAAIVAARAALGVGHWANSRRLHRKGRVEAIERFDARFDGLAEQTAQTLGVAPHKCSAYLNWKYVDRPHLDAVACQLLDEGGGLAGFCVLVNPDDRRTAHLAELVVVDNDRTGMHALLHHALTHLQKAGADRVEAVASHPSYAAALGERFFRRELRVPLFLAQSDRSAHVQALHRPSSWHVSLGDSEGPF